MVILFILLEISNGRYLNRISLGYLFHTKFDFFSYKFSVMSSEGGQNP
jgi:hypothetical protein